MDGSGGRGRSELGYTIVELLVVMSIIGVLVAVAVPIFLGAQHAAEDREAQSDLRNGLAAALTHYAEEGVWDAFDAVEAGGIEPSVGWIDGGAPTGDVISIHVNADTDLLMIRRSTSGTFFCIAQVADSPSTQRGEARVFSAVDTVPECTGGW
jgi:prepilin-type N-terminal cleavage/methylation domain-containing protein